MGTPVSSALMILGLLAATCYEPDPETNVIAEIRSVLVAARNCSENKDPTGWCQPVTVSFSAKSASPTSKGQRILVIDEGMRLAAFTRYKARVLDYVEINSNGTYETVKKTLTLPKWSNEILSHILGEKYSYLPAHALNGFKDPLFNRMTPDYKPSHGDPIFGTLADLNPQSEFVIAQLPIQPAEFCDPITDQHANARLRAYFITLSDSLVELIARHEINFINMSFGYTPEVLKKAWHTQCKSRVDEAKIKLTLFLYKKYIFKKLSNQDEVVAVQAASPVPLADPVSDIDCQLYEGRVRAGYIAKKVSTLTPLGGWVEEYLPEELRAHVECVDIFINSGVDNDWPYDEGPFPMFMTSKGIHSSSFRHSMTTSWAAPLVLSYLIYLKNQAPEKTAREILTELRARGDKLMIDPFKHKQLSIFNQKY